VILASSQFIFLQSKTLGNRIREKKAEKEEAKVGDNKVRSPTLPKVNLFKLSGVQRNVKMVMKV
jgi:hypothetical protein